MFNIFSKQTNKLSCIVYSNYLYALVLEEVGILYCTTITLQYIFISFKIFSTLKMKLLRNHILAYGISIPSEEGYERLGKHDFQVYLA